MMRTEINNQETPLYFLGADALDAEKTILLQRKSDDFTEVRVAQIVKELQLLEENRQIEVLNRRQNEDIFLRDVEPLRTEEARLRNLNLNFSHLKLVTIDRSALEPLAPVKPQKLLIVLLGILSGAFLGIGLVIIRHFLSLNGDKSTCRIGQLPFVTEGAAASKAHGNLLEREYGLPK
jgi:LPS O-antigen subunit length determinant protein (WzzB/FepE family)